MIRTFVQEPYEQVIFRFTRFSCVSFFLSVFDSCYRDIINEDFLKSPFGEVVFLTVDTSRICLFTRETLDQDLGRVKILVVKKKFSCPENKFWTENLLVILDCSSIA